MYMNQGQRFMPLTLECQRERARGNEPCSCQREREWDFKDPTTPTTDSL